MITSLSDWFKVLAPFFQPIRSETKTNRAHACTFSRALCRLRVITLSFDWFTGLSPFFLIGQSNYFGFGFTTLNRRFSGDVITAMLVDENKRSLISFFCSSTRSRTFLHCYWCLWRLVENVLLKLALSWLRG